MTSILAILSAIASAVSGIAAVLNNYFAQQQQQSEQQAGANQQIVTEEAQKAKDEVTATQIDAQPTPTDKHSVLDGM